MKNSLFARRLSTTTVALSLVNLASLFPAATFAAPPAGSTSKPVKTVAKPRPAAPPATGEVSKGTEQMKGASGVFGVVYTMQYGENLQLISAKYTLEGHIDYAGTMPRPEEKIFWLTYAEKNPGSDHDMLLARTSMTLIDANGNNYEGGNYKLTSTKTGVDFPSMKPGQGFGQDPLTNELSIAWAIPGDAKIVKIIVNDGRAVVPSEKVLRFNIAGYPGGSPKNIIAPLPKYAADPTDPTGATTLLISPAVIGKYYPSGYFGLRADAVATSTTELLNGNPPADGKEWFILTVTAKNAYYKSTASTDHIGDEKTPILRDADGEKYRPAEGGQRKVTRDEDANAKEIEPGEETSFRYFFEVPKGDKLKTVTFGGYDWGHVYQLDLTAVQ